MSLHGTAMATRVIHRFPVYAAGMVRFVAAFIGSPSMNFLPIRLESEGGKLQVKGHGFQITLPPDKAAALKGDGERDAVLGIRPENLLLRPRARKKASCARRSRSSRPWVRTSTWM